MSSGMSRSLTNQLGLPLHAQMSPAAFFCVESKSTRSPTKTTKRPWASGSASRLPLSTVRTLMVKRATGPGGRPMRGSGVGVGAGRAVGAALGAAEGLALGPLGDESPPPQAPRAAVRPNRATAPK